MDAPNYAELYDELRKRLVSLVETRADLEAKLGDVSKEIEGLQETMSHLAPLAGFTSEFDELSDLGITDAVRSVLDRDKRMSPAEVRAKMEERGYNFTKYSAPDASIRTILKRLVEAGKAAEEKEGRKIFYIHQLTDEEIPF